MVAALTLLICTLVRDRGRRIESGLWETWGGPPTSLRLRWGPTDAQAKTRSLHKQVTAATGVALPDAVGQASSPTEADRVYEQAVLVLRERTRDPPRSRSSPLRMPNMAFAATCWAAPTRPSGGSDHPSGLQRAARRRARPLRRACACIGGGWWCLAVADRTGMGAARGRALRGSAPRRSGDAQRRVGLMEESVSSAGAKRNDPCPCGSGKKCKRCCLDSARQSGKAQAGNSMPLPADELTVMVRAGSKIAARRIPSATPLQTSMGQGYAAEAATRDAATLWGLPDFVYEAGEQRVGPGTRELGDGILIIGELGIVLQVKSRVALSGDPEKERRWLEKNIAQALAQGTGTIRQLGRKPATLTNLRGRTIDVDGSDHRWLIVAAIRPP